MGAVDPAVTHTRALLVREVMAQLAANYLAAHNVELTAQFLCVMRAPDPVIRCLYSVMSETRDDHYDICVMRWGN